MLIHLFEKSLANAYDTIMTKQKNISEYGGYKIGDEVNCTTYIKGELSLGKIQIIHLSDKSPPCFTFGCVVTGACKLAMFSDIIENPTKSQIDKVRRGSEKLRRRK